MSSQDNTQGSSSRPQATRKKSLPEIVAGAVLKARRSINNIGKSSKDSATTEPVPQIDRGLIEESTHSISAAQLKQIDKDNEAAAKAIVEDKRHILKPDVLMKNLDLSETKNATPSSSRQTAASSSSALASSAPHGLSPPPLNAAKELARKRVLEEAVVSSSSTGNSTGTFKPGHNASLSAVGGPSVGQNPTPGHKPGQQ